MDNLRQKASVQSQCCDGKTQHNSPPQHGHLLSKGQFSFWHPRTIWLLYFQKEEVLIKPFPRREGNQQLSQFVDQEQCSLRPAFLQEQSSLCASLCVTCCRNVL